MAGIIEYVFKLDRALKDDHGRAQGAMSLG